MLNVITAKLSTSAKYLLQYCPVPGMTGTPLLETDVAIVGAALVTEALK